MLQKQQSLINCSLPLGFKYHSHYNITLSFFLSLLQAAVQPTLDPSADTVSRSNALAQGEGGNWLVCASVCVTCRAGRLSRREQLVGYLLTAPPQGVAYCLANVAGTYAATATSTSSALALADACGA